LDRLLEKALRKISDEIGKSSGEKRVEPKDALLFMARRMLDTEPQATPKGRTEKESSIYTVLYHQCQSCGASSLPTADGPVEIDREVVERVAAEARKVTIEPEEESASAGERVVMRSSRVLKRT